MKTVARSYLNTSVGLISVRERQPPLAMSNRRTGLQSVRINRNGMTMAALVGVPLGLAGENSN